MSVPLTRQPLRVCRPLPQAGEVSSRSPLAFTGEVGNAQRFRVRGKPRSGDRLKGSHDVFLFDFNGMNIYIVKLFPLQISYLYRADEPKRPCILALTRHRGGGRPRSETASRERFFEERAKVDEQFCCRRSQPRQSQRGRRAAGQPQRVAAWRALQAISCPPPARARLDRGHGRADCGVEGHGQVGVAP